MSYLPIQVFEHLVGLQFRAFHAEQKLYVNRYSLLPSSAFLCTLDAVPVSTPTGMRVSPQDWTLIKTLKEKTADIINAVKFLKGRKKVEDFEMMDHDHDNL